MKKPLAIIFNDVHLKPGNEKEILSAFNFMLDEADNRGINRFIFAGDLFDSRTQQKQEVLLTLDTMLSELSNRGMSIDIIPGNHDKTLYASYDSFLDIYSHYPDVTLWRDISDIEIDGVSITLLPFFSDDMLIPMLDEHKGSDVLISHFEMAGSTNLGRTSEKTSINQKMLKKWKKTYLGHYHNYHEITKDIVHLPSFIPASFGEDNNKGFSVLYNDLSYELVHGRFREYNKIEVNLDNTNITEIKALIKTHENKSDSIRFEFTGPESKLKALDKNLFKGTGIDIKIKYEQKFSYDETDTQPPTIIERYNKSDIQDTFKSFCEEKGYKYQEGKALLDEFFKQ